jgi:hypothetical protein
MGWWFMVHVDIGDHLGAVPPEIPTFLTSTRKWASHKDLHKGKHKSTLMRKCWQSAADGMEIQSQVIQS